MLQIRASQRSFRAPPPPNNKIPLFGLPGGRAEEPGTGTRTDDRAVQRAENEMIAIGSSTTSSGDILTFTDERYK
jgi:hypothetical protein